MPSRGVIRGASTLTSATTSQRTAASACLLSALRSLSLEQSQTTQHQPCSSARRSISFFGRRKPASDSMPNPLEAAVRKQTDRKQLLETFQKSGGATIFEDEVQTVKKETAALEDEEAATAANAQQQQQQQSTANRMRAGGLLDPDAMARAADPDPRARVRWERKMAIRAVRNATDPFAREPRELRIKRTERQLLSKSPFLPTSQKKLVMLARQIQGKTVEDALVQMRYSKKKMAREVALQLKMARDLAIVERGMGLGKVTGEASQFVQQVKSAAAAARAAPGLAVSEDGEKALMLAKSTDGRPGGVKIQTKDKRWLVVDDPTTLYVSEAWIGRGQPRTRNIEYRARGRSNLLVSPSTSITVVLKEEKTRIREYKEREAKIYRKGPWIPLPNKRIAAQRQYYSW